MSTSWEVRVHISVKAVAAIAILIAQMTSCNWMWFLAVKFTFLPSISLPNGSMLAVFCKRHLGNSLFCSPCNMKDVGVALGEGGCWKDVQENSLTYVINYLAFISAMTRCHSFRKCVNNIMKRTQKRVHLAECLLSIHYHKCMCILSYRNITMTQSLKCLKTILSAIIVSLTRQPSYCLRTIHQLSNLYRA